MGRPATRQCTTGRWTATRRWLLAGLALMVPAMMAPAAAAPAGAPEATISDIDGAALAALLAQQGTLIDIRRADEWRETGVVPGSRLITAYDAQGRLDPRFLAAVAAAAAKDAPVALICRSGNRSATAARLLAAEAGYTRVYNVEGGVRAWTAAGRPLEPCPTC